MRAVTEKTLLGVLTGGLLLVAVAPVAGKVERIELDIAGYLCGF